MHTFIAAAGGDDGILFLALCITFVGQRLISDFV